MIPIVLDQKRQQVLPPLPTRCEDRSTLDYLAHLACDADLRKRAGDYKRIASEMTIDFKEATDGR